MSRLRDSIGIFRTGDLVFTRYPPPPNSPQPIHVTLFLEPGGGHGPRYIHAGEHQLEIQGADGYATDKDSGGYLRASPTNETLRSRAAEVATTFTETLTPYGSYPSSKDFSRLGLVVEGPHASRFTGMVRTRDFAQIPFEFPSLVRLLKWTVRAIRRTPLSENRGITCAAFVSICQQVARMLVFLEEVGTAYKPEKIETCLNHLNSLIVSKATLRAKLALIGTDPTRNNKPIYRDQAYRENSNRTLTKGGRRDLDSKRKSIEYSSLPPEMLACLRRRSPQAELEGYWLVIQTEWLGIHPALTKSIEAILGEFFFDAKYVSSPVLAQRVQTIGWKTEVFKDY